MKPFDKPIYVTQPSLAPLAEVDTYMSRIWASGVMTHNGPLVQLFEKEFSEWAGLPHIVACCNGTMAIQLALRSLNMRKGGEIITTPFTFIATISAILYEGFKPVFVDIDPETLNIDPRKIESAITSETVAILPVHVFGNPCDVAAIGEIARRHGLHLVYDAAHAVGVNIDGRSILSYGDVSATSFHATKLLNTSEGGGVFSPDAEVDRRLRELRFFGYDAEKDVSCVGTNAKMTEVNAAIGLANLKYLDEVILDRKEKYGLYKSMLCNRDSVRFQRTGDECNCSYFPIVLESEALLGKVDSALRAINVFARRYFYPSVNTYSRLPVDGVRCPISENVSSRILCLPLYRTLPKSAIESIAECVCGEL